MTVSNCMGQNAMPRTSLNITTRYWLKAVPPHLCTKLPKSYQSFSHHTSTWQRDRQPITLSCLSCYYSKRWRSRARLWADLGCTRPPCFCQLLLPSSTQISWLRSLVGYW